MQTKTLYIFILGVLLMACSQQGSNSQTATSCLELAETALANDSIRQGETLLRKAIQLAEASKDWHTDYIAHQRLAEALSQSNPEEALQLMKQALTVYEQHPDDEHNYVILLDYAGTFAAQVAYINEGAFDEALDFIHRAYDIAKKNQMNDMMCQTLTSLANIAWAQEDYRQALDCAHQAETVATDELRPGTLQVLARSYLSLNMLDSAENVYRKINPGDDVHLAYIVQSNLAKIALRRMGATQVEDSVAEAFDKVEDIYYKALEQKDEYYQETLRQEMENQQLEYRSQMYARTLFIIMIASLIVIIAMVLVVRYRMQAQRQAQRQLQQEADYQKAQLHQANEVDGSDEETQPERRFAHLSQSARMERDRAYARCHRQQPLCQPARAVPQYAGGRHPPVSADPSGHHQSHHRQHLLHLHLCRSASQAQTKEGRIWRKQS